MNCDLHTDVAALYADIDCQIASFQMATGFQCPPGCGQCCQTPYIDATPLEMLPVALVLFRRGEALQWLDRVSHRGGVGQCIFYQPDPQIPGNGRCQVYPWRPSLCRLFGFSAHRDKQGNLSLSTCQRHKHENADIVGQIQSEIASGLPIPVMADLTAQVANLDPYWGYQRMPINQALRIAIEQVGISQQILGDQQSPS